MGGPLAHGPTRVVIGRVRNGEQIAHGRVHVEVRRKTREARAARGNLLNSGRRHKLAPLHAKEVDVLLGHRKVDGTGVISNTHVYTERADDSAVTRLSSVSRNVLACNPKVFVA